MAVAINTILAAAGPWALAQSARRGIPIGVGVLVFGGAFLLPWLSRVGTMKLRVPSVGLHRGQTIMAWRIAPLGFGGLVVGTVLTGWHFLIDSAEAVGPLVGGAVLTVSWLVIRAWPTRLWPLSGFYDATRRLYGFGAILGSLWIVVVLVIIVAS